MAVLLLCPPSAGKQGLQRSEKTLKDWPHSAETSFKRKLLHFALHLEINVGLSIFIARLIDEVLPLQLSLGPASAVVQTVYSVCPTAWGSGGKVPGLERWFRSLTAPCPGARALGWRRVQVIDRWLGFVSFLFVPTQPGGSECKWGMQLSQLGPDPPVLGKAEVLWGSGVFCICL